MSDGGQRERGTAYWFVGPLVLFLLALQLYPLLQEVWLSFTSTGLLTPRQQPFVGLRNYTDLVEAPELRETLVVTAVYTASCVAASVGIGLGVALLLDSPFRGRGWARALVTVPWAAPPVAVALIFSWIYNAQYGIFNRGLRLLGLPQGTENWLDSYQLALPAVLITTIWQIFPFASVVLLAALQGVPAELREAATIDGAGRVATFRAVVWPTIRPSVALLALFATIWSLRRFDLIWLLTQGGPIGATNTLVIELYRRAFVYRELGPAAAIGVVGLVLALVATVVYFRAQRRMEAA